MLSNFPKDTQYVAEARLKPTQAGSTAHSL